MLPDEIIAEATERGLTVACAESVTGGAVASALIGAPGASDVVLGGIIAYTVPVKVAVLGVDRSVIDEHGVVSEQVALAMARRARDTFGSDIGVGTTGAAGPEPHGGKAPGTVCLASVGPAGDWATTVVYEGDRVAVRAAAVADALRAVGRALGHNVPSGETSLEHN